jgi:trk system potassium uptake protein TrkH
VDAVMYNHFDPTRAFSPKGSLYPKRVRRLRQIEVLCQAAGIAATAIHHGLREISPALHVELGSFIVVAVLFVIVSTWLRYTWSLAKTEFLREYRMLVAFGLLWSSGVVAILIFGPALPNWIGFGGSRPTAILNLSEALIGLSGITGAAAVARRAATRGWNPALVLVLSFLALILVGTLLLMLPRARALTDSPDEMDRAPLLVALFTATSASCVTGLVVVPTGTYWSRMGQTIILALIQLGGLGIMTCGAFFAITAGSQMQVRESATLRDLLESEGIGHVRRLVLAILGFTIFSELIGAVLLSGLWADRPLRQQIFYSVFHSVSAFCNAGFALTDDSFVGMATRWQVWGVVSTLIILGGLGFAVLHNVALVATSQFKRRLSRPPLFHLPQSRVRLTVTSKLVLTTTLLLLVVGASGYFFLEGTDPDDPDARNPLSQRIADAWFQSVTFRTAGFNSVDHAKLEPATKLFAIVLMFIGASPGSTGGGVKTVCFAISVLAVASVLRGREQVETYGRSISTLHVNRALMIIALGMVMVMTTTLLLAIFENNAGRFLDHLFEATSAFATVGVSAGVTPELTVPSQLVIILTMFLGRVGPLTLLLALGGKASDIRYEYPFERVTLG